MNSHDPLCESIPSQIPTPIEIKNRFPLDPSFFHFVQLSRSSIQKILDFEDDRILLIVGPCSIHDTTAAIEFATKLNDLSKEVSDVFFIVMRTYYEKPRTCIGWKGLVNDPFLDGSHDIAKGLEITRQLLITLCEMGIPVAAEILEPMIVPYFEELISWGCIGARTSESQVHRELASSLNMPVGFKNNTSGNIQIAIKGIISASMPHVFLGVDLSGSLSQLKTKGNCCPHLVLRGGENKPNYQRESIIHTISMLEDQFLLPRMIIDCSHDNSLKDHQRQPMVFQNVIEQIYLGQDKIRGLILESNLLSGNQHHSQIRSALDPRISITDACLDWKTTENLISWAYEKLKGKQTVSPYESQEKESHTELVRSTH